MNITASLDSFCKPTGFIHFSPGMVDADVLPLALLKATDEAVTSAAKWGASCLSPLLTNITHHDKEHHHEYQHYDYL